MKIDSKLNSKQALYLLWTTILNQSQSANATLEKTLALFERLDLNKVTPEILQKITYEKILDSVSKKPAIHRFKNLYLSILQIIDEYEGNPCLIFENFSGFSELKKRLMEFKGIGEHKANIAASIFENFVQKDKFIMKKPSNCESLLLTLDKELQILNGLRG